MQPLRILVIGAHPDDSDIKAGGTAAKWCRLGHTVGLVSVTDGSAGHQTLRGPELAARRRPEAQAAGAVIGASYRVLGHPDGALLPTLEARHEIIRLIRSFRPDLVLTHRPNDYHPDHRNVGMLMQDAAYMVTVPFFCPDTPHLTRNPVFLFYEDGFQKPNPFSPDVVVAIDDVIDKKLLCVELLESQFYEGGCCSELKELPKTAEEKAARKRLIRKRFDEHFASTAERHRAALEKWYGKKAAAGVRYAEAFEVCEYGRRPGKDELRKLFPFGPGK